MAQKMKTILIIHDELKARKALCLSTFFSFCGIWVDQIGADRSRTAEKILDGYDVVLNLWEEETDVPQKRSWKEPVVLVDFRRMDGGKGAENCENVINYCLDTVLRDKNWTEDSDFSTMRALSRIYQEESLRIFDYNGRYYFYDKELSDKTYTHYKSTYKKLNLLNPEGMNELMLLYAKAYCIKCMNNLDLLNENVLAYDALKVISAMEEKMEGKDCSPSYSFLMGQLLLNMEELSARFPAVRYFNQCRYEMRKTGNHMLGFGKVYYAIGSYWEKVREQVGRALDAYNYAYEEDDCAFRAIYKLAMYELDFEEAEFLYRRILRILENKRLNNCLQPMETEYVYKTLFRLESLYIKNDKRAGVQECCEKIKELYQNHRSRSQFYDEFYDDPESGATARELTGKRILPRQPKIKMNNYFNKKIGRQ